jgi:hypothetical protein
MKRLIVMGVLVLSMVFTLGFASNAVASGRAAGLLVSLGETSAVALIDFDAGDFTQAEAQQLTGLLQLGALLLPQLLAGQGLNLSPNVTVFTPSQMAGFGLGDADDANSFIVTYFALFGVDAYIKAVATKVQPPQGVTTGQNIRLDLYLLAPGLGALGSQLSYVGSVEVQEQLINQLSGLLTLM